MFFQGLLFELPRMLHSTCFLCQCCHEFFLLSNYTCQLMGSLLAANWINFDLLPTAFIHLALAPSHKKNTCMSPLPSFHPPKKSPPGSAEVAVGCRLFTSGSMISSYSNKPGAISFQGRALQEISRRQSRRRVSSQKEHGLTCTFCILILEMALDSWGNSRLNISG